MLENERYMVQKIDTLIFNMLKKKMEIRRDKISIISDNDVEEILKKINGKMKIISLLFQGNFSNNERTIEEKIGIATSDLSNYDKIANKIILKRLDSVIAEIEKIDSKNGRLVSVCLDRKLFIEKVLTENIPLHFIDKHIQKERD